MSLSHWSSLLPSFNKAFIIPEDSVSIQHLKRSARELPLTRMANWTALLMALKRDGKRERIIMLPSINRYGHRPTIIRVTTLEHGDGTKGGGPTAMSRCGHRTANMADSCPMTPPPVQCWEGLLSLQQPHFETRSASNSDHPQQTRGINLLQGEHLGQYGRLALRVTSRALLIRMTTSVD